MASVRLKGSGELRVGNDAGVVAGYEIDVQQHGHREDARGILEADAVLSKALRAGEATLILDKQSMVSIVLTNHIGKSCCAGFVTYGAALGEHP